MNPFIKKLLYLTSILIGLATPKCAATIEFANRAASMALNPSTAKLYVGNPAKITGWTERSIVKAYGNNASTAWPENYASNAVIAQTGAGTTPARTTLVDANSNAINTTTGGLRTTSNLLLYVARTYSSSLVTLNWRTDSTNQTIRTTSNAVNLLFRNLTVPVADSIDGTQFVKYITNHYVFHNNGNAWTARGWVRFNNGFTVMPLASVLMDTLTTVSGGFDLRDTGTLILNNDLYLTHNVTLTNGGNIKGQASSTGQANTIFMGGDLTLASTTFVRTLHITGDWSNSGTSGNLIIDGCGHTLNIGDRAQIFVDTNVTLTLRNMTIKTGPMSLNNPAIQLAAHGSKLALDNVMFDLGADFHFITGQIFVHNEVAVTGTSAFVYQSPKPSYITSGATLSFEQATTFSVAPSTYTDLPYTAGTATSNNFMVLADASAALSLNGCSFQTTFTGLRLSKGTVLFDNKVAIDTTAGVDLNNTTTTPVGYVGGVVTANNNSYAVSWAPNSRFLAVVNNGNSTLQIYRFNGSGAPIPTGGTAPTGVSTNSVSWSPDGRFIAIISSAVPSTGLQVYRFNGNSAPTSLGTVATGSAASSVSWSPDGRFLAITNSSSPATGLQIYRFNGSSAPTSLGTIVTGSAPYATAWSPDGRFLAVLNQSSPSTGLQICRFNGTNTLTTLGTVATGTQPIAVAWSPDGRFLSVLNFGSPATGLQVYQFNGSSAPTSLGTAATTGINPYDVKWSPDGRFIAMLNEGSPTTGLQLYRFNGSSSPISLGTIATAAYPYRLGWSPDGQYIAVLALGTPSVLQIFRCNYYYSGQPSASQGFTNGLLFGDKAKGSDFDATVRILASSTVNIKGRVKDDSF